MTGARASSREQNPAYRACTYGDAAFRSIPFFMPPAQAAKAADEKTGGGPGNPGSKRTDGAGTAGNRRGNRQADCGQAAGRQRRNSAGTAGKPAGRLRAGMANWQRRIAGRLRTNGRKTGRLTAGRLRRNGGMPGGTHCPPVFRSGRHPVRGQGGGRLAFFLTLPPQWRTCANISGKAAATNGGYWA